MSAANASAGNARTAAGSSGLRPARALPAAAPLAAILSSIAPRGRPPPAALSDPVLSTTYRLGRAYFARVRRGVGHFWRVVTARGAARDHQCGRRAGSEREREPE